MAKEREPKGLTGPSAETPKCACGSGYKAGHDGACFDCRIEEWPEDQIKSSKHFGPGVIGKAQYQYVQEYILTTDGGRFGPALLGKYVANQVRVPANVPAKDVA